MSAIVSASRRTDIPCLYGDWFMERVRAGYCTVTNPFNADQVRRVDLRPEATDAIVFWTKEPTPLMRHLSALDAEGFRYYFQYTVTAYPRSLEPSLRPLEDRLGTFRRLAEEIGPNRIIWRYDPILLTRATDYDFHRHRFEAIARALSAHTTRVVLSIADLYRNVAARLRRLEVPDLVPQPRMAVGEEFDRLIGDLAAIASGCGLEIVSCAEKTCLSHLGVSPGKCIDDDYIARAFGVDVTHRKDPGQREECLCVESTDIGAYDTCVLGCAYCYATRGISAARRRYRDHDPASPSLVGWHDVPEEQCAVQKPLW